MTATASRKTLIRRSAARSQRGMTLLEILIVLAILALVIGLLIGPKVIEQFQSSKTKVAKLAVTKLANEAYGQWALQNQSKACPESISELSAFGNKETKDPWGNEYQMLCGGNLPAGVQGLAVFSNGADGKANTTDDIKSWE